MVTAVQCSTPCCVLASLAISSPTASAKDLTARWSSRLVRMLATVFRPSLCSIHAPRATMSQTATPRDDLPASVGICWRRRMHSTAERSSLGSIWTLGTFLSSSDTGNSSFRQWYVLWQSRSVYRSTEIQPWRCLYIACPYLFYHSNEQFSN
jgi:hypothetical protein